MWLRRAGIIAIIIGALTASLGGLVQATTLGDASGALGPLQLADIIGGLVVFLTGVLLYFKAEAWAPFFETLAGGMRRLLPGTLLAVKPSLRETWLDLFFFINLLYAFMMFDLLVLSLLYIFEVPTSRWLAIAKVVWTGLIAIIVTVAALTSKRQGNLILFLAFTSALVAGQILLSPQVQVLIDARSAVRTPTPYIAFVGGANVRDHNSLGYRGPLPSPDHDEDELRVIMLGGSTVYGDSGKPYTEALPGQLEQIAHENGDTGMQVHNWGVVGGVSGQEISTILHRAVDYDPDLVILYDGGNDIERNLDPRPGYPYNFIAYASSPNALSGTHLVTLNATWLGQSHLIRRLYTWELQRSFASLKSVRQDVGYGTEQWEEQVADTYLRNVERACGLAQGFDFRLVVFLQPLAALTQPASEMTEQDFYFQRQYERIRAGLNDLDEQYRDEPRCTFIDVSQMCEVDECTFVDYIHVTTETDRRIATRLYENLPALN